MKPEKPFVLAIVLLAGLLTGSPIFSEAQSTTEPIMIKTLLAEATSYQGHEIAVVGIAKDVEERPPMRACDKRVLRYGDYVFNLKDESGSILVEVMGTCGNQGGVKIARDGDRVLVKGVFIQLLSGNLSSPTTFISALNRAVSRLPQ
jgi:hypothetical protein